MSELLTRRISEIRETKKKPHYDWMHPSWRDLIIDYLASSPKARLEFLGCCGPHGIQLALSWGGGAQGKRQRPLLVTTEDWETLHGTIKIRLNSESESAVHAIISSILEATLHESAAHKEINDPVDSFLYEMAKDAAVILRERWDKSNEVIPIETLQTYCHLSETSDPLPPMPRLIPTWKSYWSEAQKELTFDPAAVTLSTYWIGKWIDLANCISKSEPRLLAYVQFPRCSMEDVQQFLETVGGYVDGVPDLHTREDYESEIEILSELKIINRLGELILSVKEETSELSERIDSKRSRLEDEVGELFPEPDYDSSDSHPTGGISIEEILSDL